MRPSWTPVLPATSSAPLFDPFAYETHLDPYPMYAALRAQAPVYYSEQWDFWALSRFEDVQGAARDWRAFSNAQGVNLDAVGEVYGHGNFLDADPPWHDVLRNVVRSWFTPKTIASLEPFVRARALRYAKDVGGGGELDIASDLCWPLPVETIGHVMGLPTADVDAHQSWAQGVLERDPGSRSRLEDGSRTSPRRRRGAADLPGRPAGRSPASPRARPHQRRRDGANRRKAPPQG
jgi:cytochrome P450